MRVASPFRSATDTRTGLSVACRILGDVTSEGLLRDRAAAATAAEAVLGNARAPACVRHVHVRPARAARASPIPGWVDARLVQALAAEGVTELWEHQATAVELVRQGRHCALATGTASGKTLAYLLPAASDVLRALDRGETTRVPTTLYLSPTKALAADQLRRIDGLGLPGLRAATLDGDTPPEARRWVRDHAGIVLTNPDMLAHTVLPQQQRWSRLLRRLSYVVVDECHVYRGVFGAHVSAVLRRLLRLALAHGARPVVVCCSATVVEPARLASRLTGVDMTAVVDDASPDPGATTVLWDPVLPGSAPDPGAGGSPDGSGAGDTRRRPAAAECADLMADLVADGVRTLAFTPSRRGAEDTARRTRQQLERSGRPGAERVTAYRGGHLPEERRATEQRLRSGDLLGVAATSALELGIDVAGLDAVLMAGWPGSVASVRQRAGRSGRAERPGFAVLVARDDPLDAYVLAHAEQVLGAPLEASVTDPDNPYVLAPHLAAAAAELPLTEADLPRFGPNARAVVDALTDRGDLRRRPAGWFWARPDRPAVELRGGGRGQVQLVEGATGRVLGTVDDERAQLVVHPGAVYQHLFQTYVVTDLDLDLGVAVLEAGDPGYVTHPRSTTRVRLLETERDKAMGASRIGFGTVDVVRSTTGYVRKDPERGTVLGEEPLDLPERSFRTKGSWWQPDPVAAASAAGHPARLAGALHAAEHAAVGLLPLVVTCDRYDVAGSHEVYHPDVEGPLLLVHDSWPGGAGFAERAWEAAEDWLPAATGAVAACPCTSGCPSCVVRAGCGSGNQPLDKAGAVRLLGLSRDAGPARPRRAR